MSDEQDAARYRWLRSNAREIVLELSGGRVDFYGCHDDADIVLDEMVDIELATPTDPESSHR